MAFVSTTRIRNIMQFLSTWSAFDTIIDVTRAKNTTNNWVNSELSSTAAWLEMESVSILNLYGISFFSGAKRV
jgi:hypothetical protein